MMYYFASELFKQILMDAVTIKLFKASWEGVIESKGHISKYLPEYSMFLERLIEKGWNEKFRAGTSLYNLMLSRSLRYGLREEQAFISLNFTDIIMAHHRKNGLELILGNTDEIDQETITKAHELLLEINAKLEQNANQVQLMIWCKGIREIRTIPFPHYSKVLDQYLHKLLKESMN